MCGNFKIIGIHVYKFIEYYEVYGNALYYLKKKCLQQLFNLIWSFSK